MQPLLETSENLINHKYLNVQQLGDICILRFMYPECWDWALCDWNGTSRAWNWKQLLASESAQLGSSSGSAIHYPCALGRLLNLCEPQFLVCKRRMIIRPTIPCFGELFKWGIINELFCKVPCVLYSKLCLLCAVYGPSDLDSTGWEASLSLLGDVGPAHSTSLSDYTVHSRTEAGSPASSVCAHVRQVRAERAGSLPSWGHRLVRLRYPTPCIKEPESFILCHQLCFL